VFAGVGERTREGNDLFLEMTESGVIKNTALVFGQMDEPPGVRLRVALSALTMAEYFRDVEHKDVLLFVDNIFRFTQAGRRSRRCSAACRARRLPAHARRRDGRPAGADHLDEGPFDHVAPGDLRPADDITDPAPHTAFAHLDATTVLSRDIASLGIYPAVDPLDSTSRILDARYVGRTTTTRLAASRRSCSATRTCRTSSRSSASTSCPRRTRSSSPRARRIQLFLSQPFFVAEQFTGIPGKYTPVDETIASFKGLCEGEYDHLPEQAFLLVGGVEEAVEAAKKMEQAA
jgi:F-type H+-transporting ATPase subunit beta